MAPSNGQFFPIAKKSFRAQYSNESDKDYNCRVHALEELQKPLKQDIPWNPNPRQTDYNAISIEYFFLSMQGKAVMLDKILWDANCSINNTVVRDKIEFHRPGHANPDYLVNTILFF